MHACVFDWLHTKGLYEELRKPLSDENTPQGRNGTAGTVSASPKEKKCFRKPRSAASSCLRRLIDDQLQP